MNAVGMDFDLPQDLTDLLAELDDFIERVVKPIEEADDNIRFFDHRREDARTDWDNLGLPNEEWEQLLHRVKRLADEAGFYRYPFPTEFGGRNGTNLGMAVIREHLARKGLGLHNDLQNEHSIVGNNVGLLLMIAYGTDEQKAEWIDDLARPALAVMRAAAGPLVAGHRDWSAKNLRLGARGIAEDNRKEAERAEAEKEKQ